MDERREKIEEILINAGVEGDDLMFPSAQTLADKILDLFPQWIPVGEGLPRELTAENGAKELLSYEFFQDIEVENPVYCGCGKCDFCLDFTDVPETIIQHVPISWITIKDIYAKIVKHYKALPQPPKDLT